MKLLSQINGVRELAHMFVNDIELTSSYHSFCQSEHKLMKLKVQVKVMVRREDKCVTCDPHLGDLHLGKI